MHGKPDIRTSLLTGCPPFLPPTYEVRGKLIFILGNLCPYFGGGGGCPHLADGGGKGYPHPSQQGGTPIFPNGEIPLSFLMGRGGTPSSPMGIPHPRLGLGYPHPRSGWEGVPQSQFRMGWGTPNWNSTACTC